MLAIKNVLLANDLSRGSRRAADYARFIAHAAGAELHVAYADVLHPDAGDGASASPSPKAAMRELEVQSRLAEERDGLHVPTRHVVVRNISPAPAILDYAADEDIDVIVMGTHGRRGVSRLLIGSVAEEVVREAHSLVVTVRTPEEDRQETVQIKTVIVPIDFSLHSKQALRYGIELARLFNAEIELLHIVEETLHPAFYGLQVQSIYDVQPDIEERSSTHMREWLHEAGGTDLSARFEARPGAAAKAIIGYTDEKPCGFVVMGSHGLTGLEHFIKGSTTERVIRRASCPILTIKNFGNPLVR